MILLIGAVIALILAAVEQFRAHGQDLDAWALVVLCAAIILAHYGLLA